MEIQYEFLMRPKFVKFEECEHQLRIDQDKILVI